MLLTHSTTHFSPVAFILPLTVQAFASAQVSIRLDGVPDRLSFPLPEGVNQVLTATIRGAEVRSAWLGTTETQPSSRRVTLTKVDEGEYAINLAAREVYDLLKAHGGDTQFRVFAETADGATVGSLAVRYTMNVVPERLDFPFDEAKVTIRQRASKRLPGSDGGVRVHLGDITAGQVLVSIYGPGGKPVVDTTPMREGDILSIPLPEQDYVLRLDKLVNLLVGHDYGVFSFMPLHSWEAKRIDDLLQVVANADATFIRNEQELLGEAFAAHLRQKHEYYGPASASLSEFIEKVASRSSATGEKYGVKLPGGDIVDADTWLREQAAKMARGSKEKNGGGARGSEEALSKPGCRLDTERFERFLDGVESSGVTFTCTGSDLWTGVGFAKVLRPQLGRPDATTVCFDAFIDWYIASLEACGSAYQVRLPDGRSVTTATWLRGQIKRTEAETTGRGNADQKREGVQRSSVAVRRK